MTVIISVTFLICILDFLMVQPGQLWPLTGLLLACCRWSDVAGLNKKKSWVYCMRYPSLSSCLWSTLSKKWCFFSHFWYFCLLFIWYPLHGFWQLFPSRVTAAADSYISSHQVDLSNFLQQQPRGFFGFGFGNDLTNYLTHLKVCFCYE